MFIRCLLCQYRTTCHADLDAKKKELKDVQGKIIDAIEESYSLRREISRLQRKRDELYEEIDNEE